MLRRRPIPLTTSHGGLRHTIACGVVALLAAACTGEPAADSAGAPVATDAAAGPVSDAWTATPFGVGPVRAGMTAAEIARATGAAFTAPDSGCTHVPLMGAAGSVLAMMVDGRLARIEVKDGVVATGSGARVGDSEARIDSLYAGRVAVEPHKYSDGHYLVVAPPDSGSATHRLIFETDGQRVIEYRAGLLPAVAWVEGCS